MTLQGRTLEPRRERLNWQWDSSSISSYFERTKIWEVSSFSTQREALVAKIYTSYQIVL
jgi:hypothetical protein